MPGLKPSSSQSYRPCELLRGSPGDLSFCYRVERELWLCRSAMQPWRTKPQLVEEGPGFGPEIVLPQKARPGAECAEFPTRPAFPATQCRRAQQSEPRAQLLRRSDSDRGQAHILASAAEQRPRVAKLALANRHMRSSSGLRPR